MNNNNLLMGILFVVVFATGFMMGRFSNVGATYTGAGTSVEKAVTTKQTGGGTSTTAGGGTKIAPSSLTEGQKKMLSAMGIDPNSITVTSQMIACAEASLGASRVEEIKNGASPSFSEGVKLAACYR